MARTGFSFRTVSLTAAAGVLAISFASLARPAPEKLEFYGNFKTLVPATDISGIACAPPDAAGKSLCLIVDDETQGAQIAVLEAGELTPGAPIPLNHDVFKGEDIDMDPEAVAYAERHTTAGAVDRGFYVIGSFGRPRHSDKPGKQAKNDAKANASRRLFWVPLARVAQGTACKCSARELSLKDFLTSDQRLADAYDKPLDPNGMTVEGLAAKDGILSVGFRGPVVAHEALILDIPEAALFGEQKAAASVRPLKLGTDRLGGDRGIRDLVAVPGGFIGIAGPVQDPPDDDTYEIQRGDYTLFMTDPAGLRFHDLDGYGIKVKPEALLPLEINGTKVKVLILFDGPRQGGRRIEEFDFGDQI